MKFSPVAAIFLAALANAQRRSDIPACALPCLDDAVKQNAKCSTDDYACVCKDFSAIQGSAAPCVLKTCGQDVALTKVLPATKALCENLSNGGGSGGSGRQSSAAASSAPASSAPASSAPASSAASSAAASSRQPQQSSAAGQSTQPAQPTKAPHTTGAGAGHASTECTTMVPTGKPATNGTVPTGPVVTAGAAALAPVGGLAMLGLGALLL